MVPGVKHLLDTHVWIWIRLDHPRLSKRARAVVEELARDGKLGLAAISLTEAAWMLSHGRIEVTDAATTWPDWLRRAADVASIEILPLTTEIAIASEQLPASFPSDPADRLIAGTARVHGLTLLTADRAIRAARAVPTLW